MTNDPTESSTSGAVTIEPTTTEIASAPAAESPAAPIESAPKDEQEKVKPTSELEIDYQKLADELDVEWHKLVYTGKKNGAAVVAWFESKIKEIQAKI